MDAGVLFKGFLVVAIFGVILLPMAALSTALDNAIKNGSIRAAIIQASILTLCGLVVLIIFFIERPPFFERPWMWMVAFCTPAGALLKWLNVRDMNRTKRQPKTDKEGLVR